MPAPYRIAFVCLGNICRSPMAEAVMRALVDEAGLSGRVEVTSAGTGGWHVGEPADPRAKAALRRRGYPLRHAARQFRARDLARHDLVLGLDERNVADLGRLATTAAERAKVLPLRAFDPAAGSDLAVPDPYYGTDADFDHALDLIEAACGSLLDRVRDEVGPPYRPDVSG